MPLLHFTLESIRYWAENKENWSKMQLYVQMISGKIITLDVEPSDSILDIKLKLKDKEGIDPELQMLFFAQLLLEDHKTLADYNIQKESSLHMIRGKRGRIDTYVKLPNGKTPILEMNSHDSILQLKWKIEDKEEIPADQQRLIYAGMELVDENKSLEEYNLNAAVNILLLMPWSNENHKDYPLQFRQRIFVLILCLKVNFSCMRLKLPKFLLFEIIKKVDISDTKTRKD